MTKTLLDTNIYFNIEEENSNMNLNKHDSSYFSENTSFMVFNI
jgi:hypothetical protein